MRASISAVLAMTLWAAPAVMTPADDAQATPPRANPQRANPQGVVDLDECLRLGFAHDAGLQSDELETRIADARVREMQGQYLPSLSLQGGYSRLSDVAAGSMSSEVSLGGPPVPVTITFPPSLDNSTSVRVALQQPLFTGKRISSSIRQAELLRDSSRGDLEKAGWIFATPSRRRTGASPGQRRSAMPSTRAWPRPSRILPTPERSWAREWRRTTTCSRRR